MIPAVVGIVLFIIQTNDLLSNGKEWKDAYDSPLNTFYSILIMLWTTGLVESWKRK